MCSVNCSLMSVSLSPILKICSLCTRLYGIFYCSWRDTRTRQADISVKLGFCHPFCPCKAPDSVQESAQADLGNGEVVRGDKATYRIYYVYIGPGYGGGAVGG